MLQLQSHTHPAQAMRPACSKDRHMSNVTHEKVVIIGAGAAGLTAAIYTARANLSPVIIAGLQPGGQMTITTDVENYPGFAEVIQGPWLMTEMQSQAENVGARVVYDIVTALDASCASRLCRCVGAWLLARLSSYSSPWFCSHAPPPFPWRPRAAACKVCGRPCIR